jgi:hypothetical protein
MSDVLGSWAERARAALLLALVLAQGALGWMVRGRPAWLPFHLLLGITVLLPAAMHVGLRAAFAAPSAARRRGLAAALLVVAQLLVGGLAYLVPRTLRLGSLTGALDQALVWAHWAVGAAALLASAALCAATWSRAGHVAVPSRAGDDRLT